MAVLAGEWGQEAVLPEAAVRVEAHAPSGRNLLATCPPLDTGSSEPSLDSEWFP